MGTFPETYYDPCFWYIFKITTRFPCSYILEYMHYTYFKRRMEECLKSGIKLLLIFILSHSLARHSILLKNTFEAIQAVFGSLSCCKEPKRLKTS